MPLNPPKELTKAEAARLAVGTAQRRTESFLYRHAPVISAFLAGTIVGYVCGGW
jgi:hypothetical protein